MLEDILNSINDLSLALNNHADALRSQTLTTIPVVEVTEPTPPTEPEITLDQVQQALLGISNARSPAEAKKIVKQFGAEKSNGIKPEDYPAVLKACELTKEEQAELAGGQ